ncbi:hypothetical protein BDY19DRAFT_905627 [Irpex rosettiformis]|uniref:Uncharacterized protein n=1 Tax=Irpex rosettiformis TaxID=378272 RepID=A0ACB8U6A3_9APHY|nr:hypothetical protein BDY19DRAFT_905627 [Irpex rosettiformis]
MNTSTELEHVQEGRVLATRETMVQLPCCYLGRKKPGFMLENACQPCWYPVETTLKSQISLGKRPIRKVPINLTFNSYCHLGRRDSVKALIAGGQDPGASGNSGKDPKTALEELKNKRETLMPSMFWLNIFNDAVESSGWDRDAVAKDPYPRSSTKWPPGTPMSNANTTRNNIAAPRNIINYINNLMTPERKNLTEMTPAASVLRTLKSTRILRTKAQSKSCLMFRAFPPISVPHPLLHLRLLQSRACPSALQHIVWVIRFLMGVK